MGKLNDLKTQHGLMGAYGFVVQFTRPDECKVRYQPEESRDTFIDIWNGKRGMTVGVYFRRSSTMRYWRGMTLERLEDLLIKEVWISR